MTRERYEAEFARVVTQLPGTALRAGREKSLARFAAAGFPTVREENWKYTDLRPLARAEFAPAAATFEAAQLGPYLPVELDAHRLVFINGRFAPDLSAIGALPPGATLTTLASSLDRVPTEILAGDGALPDLNRAFMSDGLYLALDAGVHLDRPVHAVFVNGAFAMANLRNVIRLGGGSSATIIEQYIGADASAYFTNTVTNVRAGPASQLQRIRIQLESLQAFHTGNLQVRQDRDSTVRLHGVDLGGRLARSDTNAVLGDAGAEIDLFGVYAPAGRQHIDNHTRIDHAAPHCRSRESFRGILDGHGRGVFNGKIIVQPDAQKTDSEQNSAALLLSRNAEVDAKPELEIYADDVKCAHGATVGQLDEEAIFYLRSRGVESDVARSLLTYSFVDQLLRELGIEPLRRYLEAEFLKRLPGGEQLRGLL